MNKRLRELRLKQGLKLKDVAEYLGVTLRAVCNYESGIREPSVAIIVKYCKLFNVSADYLLGLSPDM